MVSPRSVPRECPRRRVASCSCALASRFSVGSVRPTMPESMKWSESSCGTLPSLPRARGRRSKLQRLLRPTVRRREIAHVARLVVGDSHAALVVTVDPVVPSAEPIRPEADGELALDGHRMRRVALLGLPEARDRIVGGRASGLLVLTSQKADRFPRAVERGMELVERHGRPAIWRLVVGLRRDVQGAPVDHLVRGGRGNANDMPESISRRALEVLADLAELRFSGLSPTVRRGGGRTASRGDPACRASCSSDAADGLGRRRWRQVERLDHELAHARERRPP